ncbi:MAG: adenylate/guanylate cyclase domain-containing protein, partial [Caldimonas sp.]
MSDDHQALETAIATLEAQRALLGDAVVDAALAPLIARRAARRPGAQQLRLVSVLFLDIVGSTVLTQRLDAEDVHEVMDGALARFSAVVQAHGGSVLQFAGDSLLAAFGHAGAREDDAERAVRAGLALLQAGRAEAAQVQQRHGHAGFDVRVGVHTGKVLLGGGVDEDGTIRGMTVNVAARMEQTAPPGALRISHDTWRHVQGLFDVEAQPPLVVKGRDAPVTTYLVQRARPPGEALGARGIEGVSTPLLGRGAELAQLATALEAARGTRQARGVTILADAGLGKSRLVEELMQGLDERAPDTPRLLARAHPAASGQPYRLLRDMLAARLGIADSDSGEKARQRFVDGLAPCFAAQGKGPVHLLGELIGLDFSGSEHLVAVDPRQLRDRALGALHHWLGALAAEAGQALLIVADDLHWADDASLDLLLQLLEAPLPLLLVGMARPALLERRPTWAEGLTGHCRIALEALGASDAEALAASLLQRLHDAPPALTRLLIRQSGGNPYYMEELLKMLIDDGVVTVEPSGWQV